MAKSPPMNVIPKKHRVRCKRPTAELQHFLSHARGWTASTLPKTGIRLQHLVLATYTYPPYADRHRFNTYARSKQMVRVAQAIEWVLYRSPYLASEILGPRGFVAHDWWPEELAEAFRLADPPSPYEVATIAFSRAGAAITANSRAGAERKCVGSAFKWWLLGLSSELVAQHLGISVKRLMEKFAALIREQMERPIFAIWAAGINPLRYTTSPAQQQVAVNYLAGRGLSYNMIKDWHIPAAKLFQSPVIKAQIILGKRRTNNLAVRPQYRPGVVWESPAQKQGWMRENTIAAPRLQRMYDHSLKQVKYLKRAEMKKPVILGTCLKKHR